MNYESERSILSEAVKEAYRFYGGIKECSIKDKTTFDLVTNVDYDIEKYLIDTIKKHYPNDNILSEETNSGTCVFGRTWTIDPIDGTYNMAKGIKLYGVQCALYEDNEIVFAVLYLPVYDELYFAYKNGGAYLNGKRIYSTYTDLEHSVVSFGDFTHKRKDDFEDEHKIMKGISSKVAKIRMFGSACVDFTSLAAGRVNGVVIFTKNKWDIAPGMLICSEAGAIIRSLEGQYNEDSRAVVAVSSEELYKCIQECYNS